MSLKSAEHLYFKIIREITSDYPFYTTKQIADTAIQELCTRFICKNDKKLIQMACCPDITQKELDQLLREWDIESVQPDRAAILAYTMKLHPNLTFDTYTGPRLKGLLKYLRFQNLELISHFSKIVRQLNQKGIVPVVIKGGAMRYMRPDLPRVMGDIDILVFSRHESDVTKKLILKLGYAYTEAKHSFDVHPKNDVDKGILDVHRFPGFLPCLNKKFNNALLHRCTKCKIFSVDAFLPSQEDLAFICLNNLTFNLKNSSCIRGIPYAVFDLMYLITSKADFNWDIVLQDIFQTGTEATSYLAMQFINKIVPNIFPKEFLLNQKLTQKIENFINRDKFYILYVHDVKYACKKLKLIQAIRHWKSFKNYLKLEGQHFFTKRIIKHPCLVRYFFKYFYRSQNAD